MSPTKSLGLLAMSVFVFSFCLQVENALAEETDWDYIGEKGPDHWGEMSAEYALCADGSAQSPIDLRDASELDLVDIEFHYAHTENMIMNNGHTIQVNVETGSYIVYNGITYDLLQFHFHSPSEHTINGEAAAMEIHFVHKDPNSGMLAVVGILLEQGDDDNEAYAAVMDNMPAEISEPQAMGEALALESLLPDKRAYYTYQGSLTTPPCSEVVRWLLLDTPVELSAAQIEAFTEMYAYNARPTMPLGARDLLLDSQ